MDENAGQTGEQPQPRLPLAIDVALEPALAHTCIERARAVGDGDHMVVVAVDVLVAGSLLIQLLETGDFDVAIGADPDDAAAVVAVQPTRVVERWHTVSVDSDLASIFAPDLAGLVRTVEPLLGATHLLLGGLVNARPLAAQLAADTDLRRVIFVCAGDAGRVASDDAITAGGLIRTLLEELDHAPQLSDAAGIAVSLTTGTQEQLGIGASDQGRRLSGQTDGHRVIAMCSQRDSVGRVPRLLVRDGVPHAVRAVFA